MLGLLAENSLEEQGVTRPVAPSLFDVVPARLPHAVHAFNRFSSLIEVLTLASTERSTQCRSLIGRVAS